MALKFVGKHFNAFKTKITFEKDSPIATVDTRLTLIGYALAIFGYETYRDRWTLGVRSMATYLAVVISLIADIRRLLLLLEKGRGEEGVERLVEALMFLATQSTCLYRIYILVRYRKVCRAIIDRLTVECHEWPIGDPRREIMTTTSRIGWRLFWMELSILLMTAILFLPRPVLDHSMPLPASGLSWPGVDNFATPYFEIMSTVQIWIVFTQITLAFASNNMFCTLAVMVCGHLDCLTLHIGKLGEVETAEEADVIFGDFVRAHNGIYETVLELNALYGKLLGLQPLYTGIVIITSTLIYDKLFLQISFDHIVELFLYCYVGDLVSEKSTALCQCLYSTPWQKLNNSQKKVLLQIMQRCQKPFTLVAGIFGPLTMEMYSKSMQMTYSMWTVFKGRASKA